MIALLDGDIGRMAVHVHLVCRLFVRFKLRVDGSLVHTHQSILSSSAYITGQFFKSYS